MADIWNRWLQPSLRAQHRWRLAVHIVWRHLTLKKTNYSDVEKQRRCAYLIWWLKAFFERSCTGRSEELNVVRPWMLLWPRILQRVTTSLISPNCEGKSCKHSSSSKSKTLSVCWKRTNDEQFTGQLQSRKDIGLNFVQCPLIRVLFEQRLASYVHNLSSSEAPV